MLVFGLVLLAGELGLDILLGGFLAGMIVRAALRGRELEQFESKLTAVGFGFLIPFFFVSSGIDFHLSALGSAEAIGKLFLFLALFLVVRGLPALLLYRSRDGTPRPLRARLLQRHRAAAGRRDHDGRRRPRRDAQRDRRRARRRGDALDADLPVRRHGAAAAAIRPKTGGSLIDA